jgi:hypothetical protein
MPSVMDRVPSPLDRCACLGGAGAQVIQCILPHTGSDHLCNVCRRQCREPIRQHRGERLLLTDDVTTSLEKKE